MSNVRPVRRSNAGLHRNRGAVPAFISALAPLGTFGIRIPGQRRPLALLRSAEQMPAGVCKPGRVRKRCCAVVAALGTTAHCAFAAGPPPNSAVNRTSNGGAQWRAPSRPCRRWLPVTSTLGRSVRASSRSASCASSISGSTRYQGRCCPLRHARCSKRSCRNTPWLSRSARGPLGSRALAGLHTRWTQCPFSPLFGASRRRAAPGNQAIEGTARMLRVRSSDLTQELAAHVLPRSASDTLRTSRNNIARP